MWKITEPLLSNPIPLYKYQEGSLGPKEAHQLIEKDGKAWIF